MVSDSFEPTKRKSPFAPVSPPPTKRKLLSTTSKTAVANFFTPTSRKPKERTTWSERAPNDNEPATLLVGRYEPEVWDRGDATKRRKIAAFDLDSTLISTSTGKKFATSASDWKWWDASVPAKLKELYDDDFHIVIFSNQGGLVLHPDPKAKTPKSHTSRVAEFKGRCAAVLSALDLPTTVYGATGKDVFRKPRPGMWSSCLEDHDLRDEDVDREHSVFVGDAGGRTAVAATGVGGKKGGVPQDFSCSDRNFAHNVGIRYLAPEEFFLGRTPRDFARDFDLAKHPHGADSEDGAPVFEWEKGKDIVLMCGSPGAGKSTFFWKHLKPLGYERINQDILKSCVAAATGLLQKGESVVIDNTNADPDTRAVWVKLADKMKVPIRCVWLRTPAVVAKHNDAVRSMNEKMNPESRPALPTLAFAGYASRFKEPKISEGFADVTEVEFRFSGTREEYAVWGKYWL